MKSITFLIIATIVILFASCFILKNRYKDKKDMLYAILSVGLISLFIIGFVCKFIEAEVTVITSENSSLNKKTKKYVFYYKTSNNRYKLENGESYVLNVSGINIWEIPALYEQNANIGDTIRFKNKEFKKAPTPTYTKNPVPSSLIKQTSKYHEQNDIYYICLPEGESIEYKKSVWDLL